MKTILFYFSIRFRILVQFFYPFFSLRESSTQLYKVTIETENEHYCLFSKLERKSREWKRNFKSIIIFTLKI